MDRAWGRFLWFALGGCVSTAPIRASAQEACPPAEWVKVVELSRTAKGLLDDRRFDEAAAELRSAYAICPEPKLRRSLGTVFELAGRPEEALSEYRACMSEVKDEKARADCEQHVAALVEVLGNAAIVLEGVPADALVFVDDQRVLLPVGEPIRVRPGQHGVEVRSEGRPPFRTAITVAGGAQARVPVVMDTEPSAVTLPTTDASGPQAAQTVTQPPGTSGVPGGFVAASPLSPAATWNWVGIGAGTAIVGLGVAFLVQYGLDLRTARDRHYDPVRQGWWEADAVGPRNLALGITFAAVGLTGVVTSAVLWPKAPLKVSVAPTPGGGVVAVGVGLQDVR